MPVEKIKSEQQFQSYLNLVPPSPTSTSPIQQDSTQISIKNEIEDKSLASTSTTIFSIVNCMVGSGVLLVPINYGNTGVLLSSILLIIIGTISYYTCTWVIQNSKPEEKSITQVLKRMLGVKWLKFYQFAGFIYMFILAIVLFLLINSSFYQVSQFILKKANVYSANPDQIDFQNYSIQWQSFGMMVVLSPFFFLKKIGIFLKMTKYGGITIFCFLLFIVYAFIENLAAERVEIQNVDLYTSNIKYISVFIGNITSSCMIQHDITQLVCKNKIKKNNERDSKIGFILGSLLVGLIGILGTFGMTGRKPTVSTPVTVYDYFEGENVYSFIIAFLFFVQQFSSIPWYLYSSKDKFFGLFYSKSEEIPMKYIALYNVIFIIISVSCQIFQVNPNIIIGIVGAFCGFAIIYLIPIKIKEARQLQQNSNIAEIQQENQQVNHIHGDTQRQLALKEINFIGTLVALEQNNIANENQTTVETQEIKPLSIISLAQKSTQPLSLNEINIQTKPLACNKRSNLSLITKIVLYTLGSVLTVLQLFQLFKAN